MRRKDEFMILNLKRYISLLLVLMLLIGIVPTVNAAELDSERTLPGETVSEASEQTEQTDPTEPTEPTEPTAPPGDTGDADLVDPGTASEVGDYAVMSIASTQNSIMLFDYADNGNYTTVLNSQVSCAYKPNGSGTIRTAYIKNMGWHFARYGGVAYPDDPLYCIEPWRSYAASTSGNSVDRDVTLDGSGSTQGSNTVYMNHADDYIYVQHADMDFRRDGLFLCPQKVEESEIIPAKKLSEIKQMSGGDSFDLGGLHIDIYDLPGHTRGSVVMLIREERVLLLGDACNYLTFLHEPYSTTVQEYKTNLEAIKPQVEEKYDTVYLSHGSGVGNVGLIDGVIQVCADIMIGKTDDVPFGFKDSRGFLAKAELRQDIRVDGGIGNVIYNKDRIF